MNREEIQKALEDLDVTVVLADGLDEAFLGITDDSPPRAVYDQKKIIDILVTRDGMTEEEAEEFFSYNISGAYVGEQTPLYVHRLDEFL